ncbi:MFS transporter [Nocardioides sp. GXQ0305]|uniref:MFS transporter n=1 Tax=Nocardioides sp. GXQ0305 TaxID=3423912 RepID=UPI003D7D6C2A
MTPAARRAVGSHALASIGMSLPWPLLLVLVWEATHDEALLGLTGAARMLPYVAVSWAAGRLADRCSRHRLVRLTLWIRAALLVVVAVAVATDRLLVAVLAATACIAAATPAYPALGAGMPRLAGTGSHRATELLVTAEVTSFVVGPAIGGLMLAPAARPFVPVLSAALVLAAVVVFRGIEMPAPTRSGSHGSALGVVRTMARSGPLVHALLVICTVSVVCSAASLVLLPLAEEVWGQGETGFGIATAAFGFGGLAGPLMARLGRGAAGNAAWSLGCVGVPLVLVAVSPGLAWALVPLTLVGAAAVQVEALATETFQHATPDRYRASVLGIGDTAIVAAALVGSLVGPVAASALGARGLTALLGVLAALLVLDARRMTVPARTGIAVGKSPAPQPVRS